MSIHCTPLTTHKGHDLGDPQSRSLGAAPGGGR